MISSSTRRCAAGGDAIQRRACAGQPRHRPGYERSMPAKKLTRTRRARPLSRDLLDERDEIFVYRFSDAPVLLQGWTTDRTMVSRALAGFRQWRHGVVRRRCGSGAVGVAAATRRKRWSSSPTQRTLESSRHSRREADHSPKRAVVYAVGIDSEGGDGCSSRPQATAAAQASASYSAAFSGWFRCRPRGRFPLFERRFLAPARADREPGPATTA